MGFFIFGVLCGIAFAEGVLWMQEQAIGHQRKEIDRLAVIIREGIEIQERLHHPVNYSDQRITTVPTIH